MSNILDDILGHDPEFNEDAALPSGMDDLPVGKWVLFDLVPMSPENSGGTGLQAPDPERGRTWYQMNLVFRAIGAEEGVDPKRYRYIYFTPYLDTKEEQGTPSPLMRALVNMFFAPELEHGTPERTNTAKERLGAAFDESGVSLPEGLNPAEQLGFIFGNAVAARKDALPTIISKTWLRKGRTKQKDDGTTVTYRDRVDVGDFTDDTPENRQKYGISLFSGEESGGGDVSL